MLFHVPSGGALAHAGSIMGSSAMHVEYVIFAWWMNVGLGGGGDGRISTGGGGNDATTAAVGGGGGNGLACCTTTICTVYKSSQPLSLPLRSSLLSLASPHTPIWMHSGACLQLLAVKS